MNTYIQCSSKSGSLQICQLSIYFKSKETPILNPTQKESLMFSMMLISIGAVLTMIIGGRWQKLGGTI